MKTKEKIPVYMRIEKGRTLCICHAVRKGCKQNCVRGYVLRDKYEHWKDTMKRNRYGT